MKPKVLIVDDEPDVVELAAYNLKQAGCDIVSATDGEQALKLAREHIPDLIVLDIMLPEMDGLEVCKCLRSDPQTSAIPVIMLTAKAGEVDRVLGLELGADDYLTKPFSPRELVLRAKKLMRRSQPQVVANEHYEIGPLLVDLPNHQVEVEGRTVDLTATEFKLLAVLIQRAGRVQTRDHLLRDVWEYDSLIDTRTIDTHIRRLREKLGSAARFIGTVRNVGYRFVND